MENKTVIEIAIDFIENKDYNYLDGKFLEFANEIKDKLTELLPKEREITDEQMIKFGVWLDNLTDRQRIYDDRYRNKNISELLTEYKKINGL